MARKFRFDWRMSLAAGVLLPLMVSLGFWQIDRANQNRALIQQADARRQESPVMLESLLTPPANDLQQKQANNNLQLRQVVLKGQWLEQYFLLENQTHAGKNGYYVIGAVKLESGQYVLVNRGWLQAPTLRSELPLVPAQISPVNEVGEVYMSKPILTDEPMFAEAGWPKRVGRFNVPAAAKELGVDVLPFEVRLRPHSPSALVTQWPVVNIQPDKNIAYAIQWFAMAVALVICYLLFSFKQEKVSGEKMA